MTRAYRHARVPAVVLFVGLLAAVFSLIAPQEGGRAKVPTTDLEIGAAFMQLIQREAPTLATIHARPPVAELTHAEDGHESTEQGRRQLENSCSGVALQLLTLSICSTDYMDSSWDAVSDARPWAAFFPASADPTPPPAS